MNTVYDVAILGGGPAGTAAAVYAARKKLKAVLITGEFGGQSSVSTDIQNWIGTPSISGYELGKSFKKHIEIYAEDTVTLIEGELVTGLEKNTEKEFTVTTSKNTYSARSVLIATGSSRRKLSVPGAEQFEHKGLTYCASCDGPLFAGQDVAVIGGGNAGFETAAQLLAYAKSVTLLQRGNTFKADPVTVEKVLAQPNMKALTNTEILAIEGDSFVNGIRYKDSTGTEQLLPVTGIFVEIGIIPNTDFVADLVDRDEFNRITIDPWTGQTSVAGIWSAGDCSNVKYHQNNIAAGDGVKALEDIYLWIKKNT